MKDNETKASRMKRFGFRAFLRALAIFGSVYLVKMGIGVVAHAEGTLLKTGYSIAFFVIILFIMLLPNLPFPTRRDDHSQDRNTEK